MQTQKQDYTQLQKQKQDLVHCNNSFGMLLSSMESLFIKSGYKISVFFGYYNHFNDITWKTKEEIRAQLYTDLLAYKIQKMAYIKKYKKFDYPDYPPIKEIIKIIEKWKDIAKNKDEQILCDEILDLINDSNQKSINYYQTKVENESYFNKADIKKSLILSNKIHDKIDKRYEKINIQIEKEPESKFGLEIGKNPGISEFSDIYQNLDIDNNSNEIKNFEKKIAKNVKELLEKCGIYYRYNNYDIVNELDSLYQNLQKYFIEYYSRFKNLDFLCSYFKMDNEISLLEKYANNSKERERDINKYKIFIQIKNLFDKYFNPNL